MTTAPPRRRTTRRRVDLDLRCGDAHAIISTHGAALRLLRIADQPLVRSFLGGHAPPVFSGTVIAPWPNRIRDGQYTWAGERRQLPINEPERNTALHGFTTQHIWTVQKHDIDQAVLTTDITPRPGYPHQIRLCMRYRLYPGGLAMTLQATNTGRAAAPYGATIHPYLVAGPARVDHWSLQLAADQYLRVDPQRLLPIGLAATTGTAYDFRAARRLGTQVVDTAFTDVRPEQDGTARAYLTGIDGRTLVMAWNPTQLPWVQVCTGDRPEPGLHRTGLAVEPMTCPPDAFRSGHGLIHLEPDETHTAEWQIWQWSAPAASLRQLDPPALDAREGVHS